MNTRLMFPVSTIRLTILDKDKVLIANEQDVFIITGAICYYDVCCKNR